MRRISTALALAMSLLALVCAAQQAGNNTTANSKTNDSPTPPPGPVIGGMGTANYIPIWAAPTFLLNSVIYQASGNIGVGTTTPAAKLDVAGSVSASVDYQIGGGSVLSTGNASNDLFLGPGAGASNLAGQGYANTFTGTNAGNGNTTGTNNTFTGVQAGVSNATGIANAFYGVDAGYANFTGSNNTFTGWGAGFNNTTGCCNAYYGFDAGNGNTTGSSNIYIVNSGGNFENNTIRIGTQGTGALQQNVTYIAGIYGSTAAGGVAVYINANGQLGTQTSSLRFKEQIADMGNSTNALMKLRPVTFFYKPEYAKGDRTLQYGLIAEEVAQVYPELVAYDNDGKPYTVRYQYLASMLLNEVQKQYRRAEEESKIREAQQGRIESQQQQIATQQARMNGQQQEIDNLKRQLQLQNASLQERLSRLEGLVRAAAQTVAQEKPQ